VDRRGGAVQVDPIKPKLKAPGTKRLQLKCDEPLSSSAFKFNLRRYNVVSNIDVMTETVMGFQNQCKKLPKSLRDWQAYQAGAYTRPHLSSTCASFGH
jgi:hypothetical protein